MAASLRRRSPCKVKNRDIGCKDIVNWEAFGKIFMLQGILFCIRRLVCLLFCRQSNVYSISFDPFLWKLTNSVQWMSLKYTLIAIVIWFGYDIFKWNACQKEDRSVISEIIFLFLILFYMIQRGYCYLIHRKNVNCVPCFICWVLTILTKHNIIQHIFNSLLHNNIQLNILQTF